MNSFLEHTAKSLIEKLGWAEMEHTTIVFQSRRAGLVMKSELLKLMGERPVAFAPEVTTLSDLFASLSPLQKEEELFLVCRLYRIYREVTGDTIPLDRFYGWGRQLISDFSNIDRCVKPAEIPNFFDNTAAAKILENQPLDEEVMARLKVLIAGEIRAAEQGSKWEQFELLWRNLYTIYSRFVEELRAARRGYDGLLAAEAVANWKDGESELFGQNIVFVGFNYLLPVEKRLMELMKNRSAVEKGGAILQPGRTLFYWDYVENFSTNSKAFSYVSKNAAYFGNEAEPIRWCGKKHVDIIASTSTESQVQYVYPWLRQSYCKPEPTAVVICNEEALEPVIYSLPPVQLPDADAPEYINITKGFPLKNTQLYADVMARLERITGKQDATVTSVIDELYAFVMSQSDKQLPSGESDTWQRLLVQEAIYQTAIALRQFEQLAGRAEVASYLTDLRLLRNLLRRHLETISLPFHGEPISMIQVMGVLETRQMDFEHLLLLNVEEGVVPQHKADRSYIPYYLRKTYGLPTNDEEADVYAYNFFRLLSRAGNVTMLFSSGDSGLNKKSMSRFVMQMLASDQFEVGKHMLTENGLLHNEPLIDLTGNTKNLLSKLVIDDGQLKKRNSEEELKPYVLSPSAINTFVRCPRRFYLHYIENVHEQETPTAIFRSNELGSFVHHCMEHIYRDEFGWHDSPIMVDAEKLNAVKENQALLSSVLDRAYESMNTLYKADHPEEDEVHYVRDCHQMENEVILANVRNVLSYDIEKAAEGLEICMLEKYVAFDVPVSVDGQTVNIRIGGNIDRLDIVGNGTSAVTRVIDYKSAKYDAKKLTYRPDLLFDSEENDYVRQTFIYSEAVGRKYGNQHVEPHLLFTQRRISDEKSMIVKADGLPLTDYAEVREDVQVKLTAFVEKLLTTTEFPGPKDNKCPSYCPFTLICGAEMSDN